MIQPAQGVYSGPCGWRKFSKAGVAGTLPVLLAVLVLVREGMGPGNHDSPNCLYMHCLSNPQASKPIS